MSISLIACVDEEAVISISFNVTMNFSAGTIGCEAEAKMSGKGRKGSNMLKGNAISRYH